MATPIATGDANATALLALTSLEEQYVYMGQLLAARQNTYNTANATSPKTAIQIQPDFVNNTITINSVLPLASDAVTSLSAGKVNSVFTGV